jgi:metal-responsive CopG/Arc/MetJ family transcriptional regulator
MVKAKQPKYIINVSFPVATAEKLDDLAARRRTTRSALIREAVEKMVKERKS